MALLYLFDNIKDICGELAGETNYKNDKREGSFKRYYRTGKLVSEGTYKNGRKEGRVKKHY